MIDSAESVVDCFGIFMFLIVSTQICKARQIRIRGAFMMNIFDVATTGKNKDIVLVLQTGCGAFLGMGAIYLFSMKPIMMPPS